MRTRDSPPETALSAGARSRGWRARPLRLHQHHMSPSGSRGTVAVESANKARGERGLDRPSAMAVVGTVAGVRESSRSARAASSLWPLACREPRIQVDRAGEENLCRAEKK